MVEGDVVEGIYAPLAYILDVGRNAIFRHMSFKYRIKTYKDEEGEYSEYQPADKETILKIINDHWTNDTSPNGLEIISITTDNSTHLLLEHFQKGAFDVYFLPTSKEFHFHKKSYIDIVYSSLDHFFENDITGLELSLNKTKKENKYIRGDFFFIDHDYRINKKRSFKELTWVFVNGLPIGLMITLFSLALFFLMPIEYFIIPLFILALGTYMWLPGVLLHLQYTNDAQDLVIRITRGSKSIIIKTPESTKIMDKSEIQTVTKFTNPAIRNPWSDYGFTEVIFKTGDIINLTNLLVDQWHILDKFTFDNIETKTINKAIPQLRKKSLVK